LSALSQITDSDQDILSLVAKFNTRCGPDAWAEEVKKTGGRKRNMKQKMKAEKVITQVKPASKNTSLKKNTFIGQNIQHEDLTNLKADLEKRMLSMEQRLSFKIDTLINILIAKANHK